MRLVFGLRLSPLSHRLPRITVLNPDLLITMTLPARLSITRLKVYRILLNLALLLFQLSILRGGILFKILSILSKIILIILLSILIKLIYIIDLLTPVFLDDWHVVVP